MINPNHFHFGEYTVLALDTDALDVDLYPGTGCFTAAKTLGFSRFSIGLARVELRGEGILPLLKRERLQVRSFKVPAVSSAGENEVAASALIHADEPDVRTHACEILSACATLASRFSDPAVILDLGTLTTRESSIRPASQERALNHVLPALHGLMKSFPDVTFAVEIPDSTEGWPLPEDLDILLSELKNNKFGWWYNTARAHRLCSEAGIHPLSWIDLHQGRLKGLHLRDTGGDEDGLPLGSGEVDFHEVRESLPAGLLQVVQMNPRFGLDGLRVRA